MENLKPVDLFLIENPEVKGTFGESAARKAWAEAEKQHKERINSALHFINAGDFAHAKSILEGAAK